VIRSWSMSALTLVVAVFVMTFAGASPVRAQTRPRTVDPDLVFRPAEPDYTLVGLPTSLRLARSRSAFRVTHRFLRPLGDGSFGDLAGDFFGLDSGARIGLEYRYGLVRNGEIGVHRTSDKTVDFFGQYGLVRQGKSRPLDLSLLASVDGTNNFRDEYSPAVGLIVSRAFGTRMAAYLEPTFVHHANILRVLDAEQNDTFLVGLGVRLRLGRSSYVVVESAPRAAGYAPGVTHMAVALEKRVGGHVFQINVSDSLATTMGQLARGGPDGHDWHLGFNISRKLQ